MGQVVSRITPEVLTANQVTMANAANIVELLAELMEQGVESTAADIPAQGDAPADWQIGIRQTGYVDQLANIEDWIITGGRYVLVYPNLLFLSTFTADIQTVWGAIATAPVAIAEPGLTANIVTTQPTSPNGPWSYTVGMTDVTSGTSTAATVSGTPSVDSNGNLTIVVSGLTDGHDYTFDVSVSATKYSDVTVVTSLLTESITATT
jgi:hypothetical protein